MSDFAAFVPVVNRPDLLVNVVNATTCLHDDLTIIDNSPDGMVNNIMVPAADGKLVRWLPPVKVFRPPVPFLFAQTMNWALEETLRRGKTLCIHMHNDAIIPDGACEKLLEYAHTVQSTRSRWGVIFTHYDVLCAYNPRVYEAIGGFDLNLPWYFSDNDYFRRVELAGWDKINSGIEVGHPASQTINSDSYLRYVNGVTFPLYREYYRAKWGGDTGQEKFFHPFGILPKEWKLGKIS
jgi:GT2 family glycosyltransferase